MTDPRQVDGLAIIGRFLRGSDLVNSHVDGRSSITLQNDDPSIRYALASGQILAPGIGFPRYQIECWGATAEQVNDLALDVVQALSDLPGIYDEGIVAAVNIQPPFTSDDQQTHRCRQIVGVQLLTQPGG
jgi:hypothetical protein